MRTAPNDGVILDRDELELARRIADRALLNRAFDITDEESQPEAGRAIHDYRMLRDIVRLQCRLNHWSGASGPQNHLLDDGDLGTLLDTAKYETELAEEQIGETEKDPDAFGADVATAWRERLEDAQTVQGMAMRHFLRERNQ